jgi:predicted PurR-regulated permease PerM
MEGKYEKIVGFTIALLIVIALVAYANSVFLLAFASVLLAILLSAIGRGTKKITHLPYPIALLVAVIIILGILALIFWLYSPLISDQFSLLTNQLPQAIESLQKALGPVWGEFLSSKNLLHELSLSNQKLFSQIVNIFSTTIGSIAGFIVFLIVGLYLAIDPPRYVKWVLQLVPYRRQYAVKEIFNEIGTSLKWWILGKLLSMILVGVLTLVGLSLLHVSLAVILAFIAGILTFIPYVGAILASIPAILVAFAQSPLKAVWVGLLYLGIHMVDGYLITPSIEQRTVSIPPALTILAQLLLVVLVGGLGLALATPLAVVAIALLQPKSTSTLKVVKQSQNSDDD